MTSLANLPRSRKRLSDQGRRRDAQGRAAVFQRAVQSYIWALPALSMYGMKEGSEKVFGKGYNVLPILKQSASTPRR